MDQFTLQRKMAWAEDRATVKTDPSADPGAKTEERAAGILCSAAAFLFGIGAKALNLHGRRP